MKRHQFGEILLALAGGGILFVILPTLVYIVWNILLFYMGGKPT